MLAGSAALLAGHLVLQGRQAGPWIYDEYGFLGNARLLSGNTNTWPMYLGPYYRWGYSLVLVPLFWLFPSATDTTALYQSVTTLNAALASTTLPLMFVYLRRVHGFDRPRALAGAVVAAAYPALAAYSATAHAETFLIPLFLLTLLALDWFLTRQGWRALLFGPAAVALYASHTRFTVLMPLCFAVLGVVAVTDRRRRSASAVNAAILAAGIPLVLLVDRFLIDRRWIDMTSPESLNGGAFGVLTSPDRWDTWLLRMSGQAWYLVVGTLGLFTLGLFGLARRAAGTTSSAGSAAATTDPALLPALGAEPEVRRSLRRSLARGWAWVRRLPDEPERVVATFLLASAAVMFLTSTLFFTIVTLRPNHLLYGRYNEVLLSPTLGVGVGMVLRARWRELRAPVLANLVLIAALLLAAGPLDRLPTLRSERFPVLTTTALGPYVREGSSAPILAGTAAALVAMALVVAVSRARHRSARWVFVVAVTAVFVYGWYTPVEGSKIAHRRAGSDAAARRFGAITAGDDVGFTLDGNGRVLQVLPFHLPHTDLVPWRLGDRPPTEWVIDRPVALAPIAAGGRLVSVDSGSRTGLWLLPGPRLDERRAEGRVLPEQLQGLLPLEGRRAEIDVLGRPPTTIEGGATVRLRLAVTHRGTGVSWVDGRSWAAPGVVRVASRFTVAAPTRVASEPRSRAELPRTIAPGERFETVLDVPVVDGSGAPLPPGRYTLAVGLLQESIAWWQPPGFEPLQVPIEVR